MIWLTRHAEATEDETGLTPAGVEQAARLARRLSGAGIRAVEHAPAARAARTAAILAGALGVPATGSELLRDRTPLPGPGEVYPAPFAAWAEQVPAAERDPGGAAIQRAYAHYRGRDGLLLVTHAFVVGWFVRAALDAPPAAWLRLAPANCGLTVLDGDRLLAVNDTGHLHLGPVTTGPAG